MWQTPLLAVMSLALLMTVASGGAGDGDGDVHPQPDQGSPLVLPADPRVACSKAVFLRFTKVNTICKFDDTIPEPECCEALVRYFGMNSTKPSRNCFCVPEVWHRLTAKQAYHGMPFEDIFQNCTLQNYLVPFHQEGKGHCSGFDTASERLERSEPATEHPLAENVETWALKVHSDWLVMTATVALIIAVPGFLLFLWPFVFDFALMTNEGKAARRARRM